MESKSYVGIDPGAEGALCQIKDNVITIYDTPVFHIVTGRRRNKKGDMVDKTKREYYFLLLFLFPFKCPSFP